MRTARQTPTNSVVLPYKKSRGKEAIKLYQMLGKTPMPWQELIVEDLMAVNDDGLWTHTKFGYSIPRRNGKTECVYMRELWGLIQGEHIMHTAHRTSTEHASWEKMVGWVEKLGLSYRAIRTMGREIIEVRGGGKIEYRTRTSRSGLGEAFDLLVYDEAQELTLDQDNALKYIITDSRNPQTIFLGTPPTTSSLGTVFTDFRKQVLKGDRPESGWAEWGIENYTDDLKNLDDWYEANPSLGTVFTERSVMDEISDDKVDFNIQRLGLWIKYNLKSAISETDWNDLEVTALPKLTGKLSIGVKFGKDGTNAAMSVAVRTADGRIFVEAIDCVPIRDGLDWIIKFLMKATYDRVVIDGAVGQQILEPDLKNAGINLKKVVFPTVKEVIASNACFEKAIFDKTLAHMPQKSLKQSITNCDKRPIGSNGGFGYKTLKDGVDVALLESAALAIWACSTGKERTKQKISY